MQVRHRSYSAALMLTAAQTPGKDAVIDVIRRNDVTVLIGETGSGKTTRAYIHSPLSDSSPANVMPYFPSSSEVPQYLLEAGLANDGMIAVTQPRKVAATSLASRVAKEQQTSVGGRVGYSVRFDEASSSETRIKYVTDGMLVRELLSDPLLSRYSVVVVDEAHERTLRTDLLIANLKTIQAARKSPAAPSDKRKGKGKARDTSGPLSPLKVVIMSATLEAEKFSRFFDGCAAVPAPPLP